MTSNRNAALTPAKLRRSFTIGPSIHRKLTMDSNAIGFKSIALHTDAQSSCKCEPDLPIFEEKRGTKNFHARGSIQCDVRAQGGGGGGGGGWGVRGVGGEERVGGGGGGVGGEGGGRW